MSEIETLRVAYVRVGDAIVALATLIRGGVRFQEGVPEMNEAGATAAGALADAQGMLSRLDVRAPELDEAVALASKLSTFVNVSVGPLGCESGVGDVSGCASSLDQLRARLATRIRAAGGVVPDDGASLGESLGRARPSSGRATLLVAAAVVLVIAAVNLAKVVGPQYNPMVFWVTLGLLVGLGWLARPRHAWDDVDDGA